MTSPAPSPITRLWLAARALFERMQRAIGDAPSFARRTELEGREIGAARTWLRTLEIMVRKLVLIEAKRIERTERPPLTRHTVELRNLVAPRPARPQRKSPRRASFRLWSRTPRPPVRIRMLGPPVLVREIWRDNERAARAQQLNIVRFMRRPEPQRIASRIEALERVLAKPEHAARRLARRLRAHPTTAHRIALQRSPRASTADAAIETEIANRAFDCARSDSS